MAVLSISCSVAPRRETNSVKLLLIGWPALESCLATAWPHDAPLRESERLFVALEEETGCNLPHYAVCVNRREAAVGRICFALRPGAGADTQPPQVPCAKV